MAFCDRLVVAVMNNFGKQPLFSPEERVSIVEQSLSPLQEVEVIFYEGLLVSLYQSTGAVAVVRGIRSESDYRNEAEMNAVNRLLCPGFDTILLPCHANFASTSSTVVREVASYGGDISGMVCAPVLDLVRQRIQESRRDLHGGRDHE